MMRNYELSVDNQNEQLRQKLEATEKQLDSLRNSLSNGIVHVCFDCFWKGKTSPYRSNSSTRTGKPCCRNLRILSYFVCDNNYIQPLLNYIEFIEKHKIVASVEKNTLKSLLGFKQLFEWFSPNDYIEPDVLSFQGMEKIGRHCVEHRISFGRFDFNEWWNQRNIDELTI